MARLPEFSKDAIGKKFRRFGWVEGGENYAFMDSVGSWYYCSVPSNSNSYLSHGTQIKTDWYEVIEPTMETSSEETSVPGESICCLSADSVKSWDRVLTEEEIQKIYKDEKERNMRKFEFKQYTKEEMEAMRVFTDLESRTKYTGELYGSDGKGMGIIAFDKKRDAKELLADPDNLGCYIVLRKEVAVYTTAVPVIKVKV